MKKPEAIVVKKPYETPRVQELGTVAKLTRQDLDKCAGSNDQFLPTILSPAFDPTCP